MRKHSEYCSCVVRSAITSDCDDDFGYWDVCVDCGKKIEDGYHYYNHYDGENHEEFWGPNGDILD